MLTNAAQTVALGSLSQAAPESDQWAMNLIWLCLAALLLFGALKWFRNRIHSDTGSDPMNFMKRTISNPAESGKHTASRTPGAPRSPNAPDPRENRDVRSNSVSDSRSSGTASQKEDLRAILRDVVQEELAKLRSEISADVQGSLRALTERIDGMQRAQPITEQKLHQQTSTPAPVPVRRAASEGELLAHWRTLRASNQVSAARMLELAAGAGVTLAEAPGLSASDPLARLGFLLTDGQGTVWFIPRPACKPSELSGIYSFPVGTHPAGVVTEVLRFAQWQGSGIATPGEAR